MNFNRKCAAALAALIVAAPVLSACGDKGGTDADGLALPDGTAAQVLKNGVIYTVAGDDWDMAPAEAVAIDANGVILAVGSNEVIETYVTDDTEVTDLGGKTMLPGFWDTHLHFPGTGLTELYQIDLYECFNKESTLAAVKKFIDENPDLDVYFGAGFQMSISDSANGPKKEWLDEICPDKPIVLNSNDVHSYWLNTKAFEEMNITKDTKLQNGSIPVDPATGDLWGVVTDGWDLITLAPEYDDAQKLEGVRRFQDNVIGWGFTGLMGVAPYSDGVDAEFIRYFHDLGELKVRLNLAAPAEPAMKVEEAIAGANEMKATFEGTDVRVSTIKFFADGVVEGVTAFLKNPYATGAGRDSKYRSHMNYDNVNALKAYYNAALDAGFQIHTHSIGDASTTDVLDALEDALTNHPDADARSVITHLQIVEDADKARMGRLNVIGNTQPFWHFKEPDWYEEIDRKNLGDERAWLEYPVRSLIDNGVTVTFSSDHPVSSVDNPFWAIEVAVTRNLENGDFYGVDDITDIDDPTWLLNPDERVSLKEAVEAYTKNAAYQVFREDEVGTIEPGKKADLIILDRDIFKINPLELDSTEVLTTIIGGRIAGGVL